MIWSSSLGTIRTICVFINGTSDNSAALLLTEWCYICAAAAKADAKGRSASDHHSFSPFGPMYADN